MEILPMKIDNIRSNIAIRWTDQNEMKRQLVVQGDYNSIAICQTKIPTLFWGIFGIFYRFAKYLFIPWFIKECPVMFGRALGRKHYPNELVVSDLLPLLFCCLAAINALWYAIAVNATKDMWCLLVSDFSVHFLFVHGSMFFKNCHDK